MNIIVLYSTDSTRTRAQQRHLKGFTFVSTKQDFDMTNKTHNKKQDIIIYSITTIVSTNGKEEEDDDVM